MEPIQITQNTVWNLVVEPGQIFVVSPGIQFMLPNIPFIGTLLDDGSARIVVQGGPELPIEENPPSEELPNG